MYEKVIYNGEHIFETVVLSNKLEQMLVTKVMDNALACLHVLFVLIE